MAVEVIDTTGEMNIDVDAVIGFLYTDEGRKTALSKLVENDIIPKDKESTEKNYSALYRPTPL